MACPVPSWPTVCVTVGRFRESIAYMLPVEHQSTGTGPRQAFWRCEIDGQPVGLYWEWVEVSPGVPALLDPLAIGSNAVLVGDDGLMLDDAMAILQLNAAVYQLTRRADYCQGLGLPAP